MEADAKATNGGQSHSLGQAWGRSTGKASIKDFRKTSWHIDRGGASRKGEQQVQSQILESESEKRAIDGG